MYLLADIFIKFLYWELNLPFNQKCAPILYYYKWRNDDAMLISIIVGKKSIHYWWLFQSKCYTLCWTWWNLKRLDSSQPSRSVIWKRFFFVKPVIHSHRPVSAMYRWAGLINKMASRCKKRKEKKMNARICKSKVSTKMAHGHDWLG